MKNFKEEWGIALEKDVTVQGWKIKTTCCMCVFKQTRIVARIPKKRVELNTISTN